MAGAGTQEHLATTCSNDPHFATICSFIEKFGESCNIGVISFDELQRNLENTSEVAPALAQIHIVLLRRVYRSINAEKWEKHLAKFGHSYDSQDAWEIERFGYKKAKIQTKLRLLKNLLESQFDFNTKFKNEVNKLPAEDLRRVPLGCDSEGQVYWYQVDNEANLRVYREDVDDDTWELVATSREEMVTLIGQLESGVVKKNKSEEDNGVENNGDGDSPKQILLDTGKLSDEQDTAGEESPEGPEDSKDDNDDDDDAMAIDEDYKPEAEDMEVDEEVSHAAVDVKTEIKNEEKERINTFELGKAVRRMLDTRSNKYDVKTKLPEIKLEPKSVSLPDNVPIEQDIKLDVVPKSEPEPNSVKIESVSISDECPVLDPKVEPMIPKEVVKPTLSVTPPVEEVSKIEATLVTNFQKGKSPLDNLLLFTDKMSEELKVSDTVLKDVQHTDIQDVMKKMDEFDRLKEAEQPSASSRNGQPAKAGHNSMPSPRLDLKPPKALSPPSQIVGSSTSIKTESSKAPTKPAPTEPTKSLPAVRITPPPPALEPHTKPTVEVIPEVVKPTSENLVETKPNPSIPAKTFSPVPDVTSHAKPDEVKPLRELLIEPAVEDLPRSTPESVVEILPGILPNPSPLEVAESTEIAVAKLESKPPPTSETLLQPEDSVSDLKLGEKNFPQDAVAEQEISLISRAQEESTPSNKIEIEEPKIAPTLDGPENKVILNSVVNVSIEAKVIEEPVVLKSTVWLTGNSSETNLEALDNLQQRESSIAPENPNLGSVEPSQPKELTLSKSFETEPVSEPVLKLPDTLEVTSRSVTDSPNFVVQEIKESPADASASVVEPSEAAPVVSSGAKSQSGLVGYAYSSSEDDNTIDEPTNTTETEQLPLEDSLKTNSDMKPSKTDPSLEKSTESLGIQLDLKPLENGNSSESVFSETKEKKAEVAHTTLDSVDSLKLLATTQIKNITHDSVVGEPQPDECSSKRKAEEPPDVHLKVLKTDEELPFNPIVGEVIEEEMVIITGQGSGAELQGGNKSPELSPTTDPLAIDEAAEESNAGKDKGSVAEEDDSDAEALIVVTPSPRGRGRPKRTPDSAPSRRGRPRGGGRGRGRGRGSVAQSSRDRSSSASVSSTPPVASKGEVNGKLRVERPTRQSSRIAIIQVKEEEERRKLEELRLAQLKAAQLKKQNKQQEKGQAKFQPAEVKSIKAAPKRWDVSTPSYSEDNDSDAVVVKPKKRGRKKKNGAPPKTLMQKGLNPWTHTSSEEEEEVVEPEEEEEEEEELTFRSDHEFSPESDLGEEDVDVGPSRHARTAKRGEETVDKYDKTNCSKCNKGDHPEWILLCDSCDSACHASCLRPQLWVIPEGQWFCPPCQHNMLIAKMSENLVEYDKILKKHENEVLRKQRLAFVGISLDNVIPPQDQATQQEPEEVVRSQKSKKNRKRVISSDDDEEDELMTRRDRFVVESDEESSQSNSEESDDGPMYKLRARRATKTFDFKEYDEMINSALRGQEDEYEEAEVYDESEQKGSAGIKNGGTPVVEDPPKKVGKGKVMPDCSDEDEEEEEAKEKADKDESDEDEDDENKEKRLKELETQSRKKTRRRLNDLDATSDEDSGSDFKGSDVDDDEDEEAGALDEDDSEWSGDRDGDDSDDSIARRGRGGKKGKYGRQEKFLEVGSVRRSTRRAKSRIIYDESDQDDDEDDPTPGWNSAESDASDSASVSEEDETWGKKKKKKAAYNPPRSKMRTEFFLPQKGSKNKSKAKPKASPKKKKKRVDDEEVDRAWNKHGGSKVKKADATEELVTDKRSTRGKKINFKDILDSGESDDDGNIHPKRRRVVAPDSDDSDAPSSSKKLVAELTAAQAKAAKSSTSSPVASKSKPILTKDNSSDSDEYEKMEASLLEQELKPVKAPPYPPVQQHVAKKSTPPPVVLEPIPPPVPPPQAPPSTNLMMSEILASTKPSPSPPKAAKAKKGGKKVSAAIVTPGPPVLSSPPPVTGVPAPVRAPMIARAPTPIPAPQPGIPHQPHRGISSPPHQGHPVLPPNMPSEISRVPNPAYYPPTTQGIRNMFPWGRGPVPPPYSQGPGGSPPQPIGKPPPLSSVPYMPAQGPPPRSNYPSPPPLRIPNPSGSPLHSSFQQFKREPQMMYRMPPQGPPPSRGPHPGLLAHMQPGHHERFYYGPAAPYGIPPPPHTQSQPLYSAPQPQQFDYRPDEPFKEEPAPQSAGSPNPAPSAPAAVPVKEETTSSQNDGEFGGLVSYFSSQRGDDDMDS